MVNYIFYCKACRRPIKVNYKDREKYKNLICDSCAKKIKEEGSRLKDIKLDERR